MSRYIRRLLLYELDTDILTGKAMSAKKEITSSIILCPHCKGICRYDYLLFLAAFFLALAIIFKAFLSGYAF